MAASAAIPGVEAVAPATARYLAVGEPPAMPAWFGGGGWRLYFHTGQAVPAASDTIVFKRLPGRE